MPLNTEDGFMRVANEITDSLLMADLTVRQLKVMLAIMRKTYGFNKPMDRLTNTQIAAMTGIHHTHVCAAKRQLIERKFLIADGVKIGVNKVVSQWISQDSLTLAKTANKTLAKSANCGQKLHVLEVHVCEYCCAELMSDPNSSMYEEEDDE
ncbi:replication protein [Escherichia coli]|nr:replication protein [Escherichia coli]HCB2276003.1 replication protein [Escherichia coli]